MLNDYKPTHDPNIDTFKVQYLLGGSAVLAILFPYRYEIAEVLPHNPPPPLFPPASTTAPIDPDTNPYPAPATDPLGLLHLARIRSHPPPTLHAPTDRRGRNNHDALPLRAGLVPGPVHPELVLSVFCGGVCGSDTVDRGRDTDGAVFGFLLDLLYQVS